MEASQLLLDELRVTIVLVLLVAIVSLLGFLCWRRERYNYGGGHQIHLKKRGEVPEGGNIVSLSRGEVFYRIDGKENEGRLVVLVHGFIGCHLDYQPLTEYLVRHGKRRVLRMDNYGRGWSTLPFNNTNIIPELFAGQLAELLFVLNEVGPIDLVGYSMGGGIVATFAEKFGKEKVASISYLAPAGLPQMKRIVRPWLQRVIDVVTEFPLGMILMLSLVRKILHNSTKEDQLNWKTKNTELQNWYRVFYKERIISEPALPYAFLSTLRTFPFAHLTEAFRGVSKRGIPASVVWAGKDEMVPLESALELRMMYSSTQLRERVFEDLSHILVVEAPELVGSELLAFWRSQLQ